MNTNHLDVNALLGVRVGVQGNDLHTDKIHKNIAGECHNLFTSWCVEENKCEELRRVVEEAEKTLD